jgi:transcriptional regulator with XRE-family HTH domain
MAPKKTLDIEPICVQIGARICELRRKRGLTQEDLARLSQLTANYVARTEGAYHRAALAKLEAIAEALGVSLADLFTSGPAPRTATVLSSLQNELGALTKDDQRLLLEIARRLRRATTARRATSR